MTEIEELRASVSRLHRFVQTGFLLCLGMILAAYAAILSLLIWS